MVDARFGDNVNRNTAAKPQVRSAPVLVPFDRPIELAPVTATMVFPGRIVRRHPHRGPVEPMDPGHVQSRQARGGAAERARVRPAPLVRLAPDPRGPVDPRSRSAGRSLAAEMPTRLRSPVRRVRPLRTRAGEGRDRRLPSSSYLSRTSRRTRTGAKPLVERRPPKAGYPRAGTPAGDSVHARGTPGHESLHQPTFQW